MNSNRIPMPRARQLAALAVATGAFMAAPSFAATAYVAPTVAGEGPDPSQQVQMTYAAPLQAQAPMAAETAVAADPTYTFTPAATVGPLSREEVREALVNWRNAGILVPTNEIGDTNETLAAREAFNEMQAEAITARWAMESQRMVAAREAERMAQLARDEIEAVLAAAGREEAVGTAALDDSVLRDLPAETTEPVILESPQSPVAVPQQ